MNNPKRKARAGRRTPAQWSTLLEQYGQSAQTQAAFCTSRGLPISSFTSALRRARESGADASPGNAFVAVEVEHAAYAPRTSAWDVELTLGAGIVLRIRGV